jgi:hypothetical protein
MPADEERGAEDAELRAIKHKNIPIIIGAILLF